MSQEAAVAMTGLGYSSYSSGRNLFVPLLQDMQDQGRYARYSNLHEKFSALLKQDGQDIQDTG
jgi:hypothetical protein